MVEIRRRHQSMVLFYLSHFFLFFSILSHVLAILATLHLCNILVHTQDISTSRKLAQSLPRSQSQAAFYRNSCRQVEAEAAGISPQWS